MRIGIFTDTFEPQVNGVVTSVNILKRELLAKGHDVFVFAPRVPGYFDETPNIFRFPSIPFVFLPEHRISWASGFFLKDFKKLGLQIIHSQTPFFIGGLAVRLARKYKLPHIHTYHTFFEKYGHYILLPEFLNHLLTRFLSRRFCHQSDFVITPSADMLKILKTYNIKTPIYEIPTGIDLEIFPEKPDENLLSRLGFQKDRQYLIYAGRLAWEKNLDFLVKAFAQLAPAWPAVDLVLIGDGPRHEHLKHLVKKEHLEKRVIFTGYLHREEVLHCFKAGKLFLFASLTESQGVVILEAMASGLPVVALKAMGINELMGGERGGFLTEHNASDFCEKIILLMQDNALWQKKSAEAKKLTEEFSASFMVDRVIKIYQKFLTPFI